MIKIYLLCVSIFLGTLSPFQTYGQFLQLPNAAVETVPSPSPVPLTVGTIPLPANCPPAPPAGSVMASPPTFPLQPTPIAPQVVADQVGFPRRIEAVFSINPRSPDGEDWEVGKSNSSKMVRSVITIQRAGDGDKPTMKPNKPE